MDLSALADDIEWTDTGWDQTRSHEATLGTGSAAFRLGTRLVDIGVAHRLGDHRLARRLATEAVLLGRSLSSTTGEEVAALRRALDEDTEPTPRLVLERVHALLDTATGENLKLGAEIEARRLMARVGEKDVLLRAPPLQIVGAQASSEVRSRLDDIEEAQRHSGTKAERLEELYRELLVTLSR
jgi:hypothetical protein